MSSHNVIVVTFEDESKAYHALSELKGAGLEGRVELRAAGVVRRDADGRLEVLEGGDAVGGTRSLGGSLIGLLIGVIGGPIGMLFGWTGGLLVGGAFDAQRARRASGALWDISTAIPENGTALVAEVQEFAQEVVDNLMASLDGNVMRRSAEEVLAQLESAEQAYKQAEKEAERAEREAAKLERQENWEERKAQLKAKLGV